MENKPPAPAKEGGKRLENLEKNKDIKQKLAFIKWKSEKVGKDMISEKGGDRE